jgi:hypothetical protein
MSVSGISSSTSSYLASLSGTTEGTDTSSSSSESTGKVYDKKDTNKDGKVSYQEEMAYEQKHPAEVKKSAVNMQADNVKELVGTIIDTTA